MFISRRLVILAAEDIGLADPQALTVAVATQQAVHFIGMPEGRIPLAEATVYLATAPKSNTAYAALNEAMADVRSLPNDPVPLHLRNAVTGLMRPDGLRPRLQVLPRLRGTLRAPGIPAAPAPGPPLLPPGNGRAPKKKSPTASSAGGTKTERSRETPRASGDMPFEVDDLQPQRQSQPMVQEVSVLRG